MPVDPLIALQRRATDLAVLQKRARDQQAQREQRVAFTTPLDPPASIEAYFDAPEASTPAQLKKLAATMREAGSRLTMGVVMFTPARICFDRAEIQQVSRCYDDIADLLGSILKEGDMDA